MRALKGSRLLPLLACAAALLLPPAGSGQRGDGGGIERHYWIVLLDVSASFESREEAAQAGDAALPGDYRMRNELLALIHTLLAARDRAEGGRREDYLSVFFFGRGVQPAFPQTMAPVRWDEVRDEAWWEARQQTLTSGFRSRSDLPAALHRAVEDFQIDRGVEFKKHLVVISDGEVDVGAQGRNPGAPPGREEEAAYQNLLTLHNSDMGWLLRSDVDIRTMTVDEGLQSASDELRQQAIRRELYGPEDGGGNALDLARGLIEERLRRIGQETYRSEGPAVMMALAEGPGNAESRSRSVRYDNIRDVLRQTFLPGSSQGPAVAPGTRAVVVLAPLGRSVLVTMDPARPPVTLTFDPATGHRLIEDPEGLVSSYDAQRSAQSVTWVVHANNITRVDAGPDARIMAVNDVDLRWRPGTPPRVTARGQTVRLAAELVWHRDSAANDLRTWRERMRRSFNDIQATVTIAAPNARAPQAFGLRPTLVDTPDSVLLVLEGEYPGTQAEGMHAISGVMRVTTPEGSWEELIPSTLLQVSSQPATRPELFVSAESEGRRGPEVRLDAAAAAWVKVPRGGTPFLHFSTRPGPEALPAPGRAPAPEAVPDRLEIVGPAGEVGRTILVGADPVEGGNRYWFSPVALPEGALGEPLTVKVVAGTATYEYRLVVPKAGGARLWRWIVFALVVVVIVLTVLRRITRPSRPLDFAAIIDDVRHPALGRELVVERFPEGRIKVSKRPDGDGDAVRFYNEGRNYKLVPAQPTTGWSYRKIGPNADEDEPFVQLTMSGVNSLDWRDVLEGVRYELRHGDRIVEIRRQDQEPLRQPFAATRTLT